ncbi:MAG TPA: gliding motility lipoprotein GldH [Chitinophagales bacterium]|nr:gliding motility lipoprotein GldH [Chitinophagales bacterium]HMX03270.1 gliding motility lipoprotein GldH [Chitinophagales bacterium]HMZ87828.1 gliding motility lipoprotein GldH [Chitinophagales bacterium]HNE45640.1 gliding motility lipoprotein GldH [Chitinophagales bacterium]HNI53219.1 gliding motility lipoprotein GldH [Chitinophagales bacterium]
MNNRAYSILFSVLVTCFVAAGCEQSRVFDKNTPIDKSGWAYGTALSYEVQINDTTQSYNLYINVRHTDAYPYNNIWINMTTTFPDGTKQTTKVDVPLSEPEGEWMGNCVDGICFNTTLIKSDFFLPQKGKYTFTLEQDMRMNPVPDILDVGIRVEKFMVTR